MKIGLRFIGVVKTSTKKILVAYLLSVEFYQGRGQLEGVVLKTDGIAQIIAYVWMDCDKGYSISTASLLSDGRPYSRVRWRQQERDDEHFGQVNIEEAVREELVVL